MNEGRKGGESRQERKDGGEVGGGLEEAGRGRKRRTRIGRWGRWTDSSSTLCQVLCPCLLPEPLKQPSHGLGFYLCFDPKGTDTGEVLLFAQGQTVYKQSKIASQDVHGSSPLSRALTHPPPPHAPTLAPSPLPLPSSESPHTSISTKLNLTSCNTLSAFCLAEQVHTLVTSCRERNVLNTCLLHVFRTRSKSKLTGSWGLWITNSTQPKARGT